ncbi:MAG: chemotaxis protein CheW [Acidobacteria bacterium]|nr:chemotaxis protein CheW [Acidobacteriota bacterium]
MSEPGSNQYATFLVDGHYLGIQVRDVQEVLRAQRLARVPLAPAVVSGLINLRGQIVPALEMRALLRLPARPLDSTTLSVVVRTESGAVSLQVDEIGDVLELDGGSFELPPLNLDAHLRNLLVGVHKLKDRLLLVLDTGRTVDVSAAYGDESISPDRSH